MSKKISLQAFKSWLSDQKDLKEFFDITGEEETQSRYVGNVVRSKVCKQKLMERVEAEDNCEQMVDEFLAEGGTIAAVEGKRVKVEVASGSFYAPRFCIKLLKS